MSEWVEKCARQFSKKKGKTNEKRSHSAHHTNSNSRNVWLEMWLLRATTTFIIPCRRPALANVCVCVPATLLDWIGFSWFMQFIISLRCANGKFFVTSLCNAQHEILSRWEFILFNSVWVFSLSFAGFYWKVSQNHTFIEHKLRTEWICHCHKSTFVWVSPPFHCF